MAKKKPLLSLDTLVDRSVIAIDGKPYELRAPGEFSLLDYHRIGKRSEQLDALKAHEEPTEEDVEAVAAALGELCRMVLVAPEDVYARLSVLHQQAIVSAFMAPLRVTPAPAADAEPAAMSTPTPSTGGSTSRGSSASTAATP